MKLYQKGSPIGILASVFSRSGARQDQVAADGALPEPLLPWEPALPAAGVAETAISLYHLDQNIGFDDAGPGAEIDDQAMNDLFAAIRDTESPSVLQDAQSTWQSLYSAHSAPVAQADAEAEQADPLDSSEVEPNPDDSDARQPGADDADDASDAMMADSDAMTGAEATDDTADAMPAEAAEADDETDAMPVEAAEADDETDVMPVEAAEADDETDAMTGAEATDDTTDAMPVEAAEVDDETDVMASEAEAVALDGADAEPVEADAAPAEVEAGASCDADDVEVVDVADFDPERDVIGVFYAKTVDAVTGKPVTPKVRICGSADGSGHIISLDGCDVARVIGAKHLAEDQIELIGE